MAMDMFLELDGIEGESEDSVKAGAIDVLAWSWGLSQSGTMHTGRGGGGGKVSIQDISITKWVDKSSTELFLHTCTGGPIAEGILTVRKAGGEALEYLVITMTDVMVTSVSTGGSGGEDRLTENVSLNFSSVKVKYAQQDTTGGAADQPEVGWDIAGNASL